MVISQPSPHAAEINTLGWRPIASLEFNYRTEGETLVISLHLCCAHRENRRIVQRPDQGV